MKRWIRRFRANLYYVRRPLVNFLPLLALFCAVLFGGGLCFQHLYRQEELTFLRALYVTYALVFMEHLIPFPEHWLLQAMYFVLPPLGLVVILDGIVRFGYHVFRRNETGLEWNRAMAKTYRNHVILVGLGKVGLRTLQQLILLKEDVVVIDKDPKNKNITYAKRNNVPVTVANGLEEGVLSDLNIGQAKSIILATDDDLANLEMLMDARRAKPGIQVVLRLFDQELASKVRESFDVDLAFSTSAHAAPLFAMCSSDRTIVNSFYIGDQLLVVARITVTDGSEWIGKRIRDVADQQNVFFLAHSRSGKETHFPAGDQDFQPGDHVTVQTEPQTLKVLHTWNG